MEIRFSSDMCGGKTPSGACDARPSRRPSGAKAPRDKREYAKGKATKVAFPFEQQKSPPHGDVIYINFRAAVGTRPFFQCIGGDRGR
jgi:hypothetical protein